MDTQSILIMVHSALTKGLLQILSLLPPLQLPQTLEVAAGAGGILRAKPLPPAHDRAALYSG